PARFALVAAVVLALVGGVWGIASLTGGDQKTATRKVLTTPAAKALFAALGASTGTGGYEVNYEFTIDPPSTPPTTVCGIDHGGPPPGAFEGSTATTDGGAATPTTRCMVLEGPGQVTVTGHGKVYLNPYSLETTSTVTGLGEVSVRTDGNLIAEQGGANYGKVQDGQPISGFAPAVMSTFGEGPGALTMLGLASPTGYLSLSANAVTDVTSAGTGTVNGAPVTYYDVVSDVNAMRDLPGLTDEQRKVIEQSLDALDRAGFKEATAHIAVDTAGYIVESSSTATFSDGTTMTRHMTLSKFGCIGTGPTPEHPDGVPEPDPTACAPPPATVTTTVPSVPSGDDSSTTSAPAGTATTQAAIPTTTSPSTAP
ncbi:MAG: hypothetical protein JJE46_04900, partial [Acidimicrobiia bacterium]|nr:hypothetical protein [Acidimicrobiia bacterium]